MNRRATVAAAAVCGRVRKQFQILFGSCALAFVPAGAAQPSDDVAAYDLAVTTEIRGQAVRIWRAPPVLIVQVTAQGGQMESWRIDIGDSPSANTDRLVGALKLGDALVVTGNPPSAAGEHRLRATSISRPSDSLAWER